MVVEKLKCLALATLAWFALGSVAIAESTLDTVKERGKVVVGVRFDTPPYGYVDASGNLVGLDIDIANYIADRLEVDIEFSQVTGQTRIPMLTSGRVDMLVAALSIFRDRTEVVDFTVPYFYDGGKVMVPKGSKIHSFEDLGGTRVATVQGTPWEELISRAHPTARVLSYQEYPQALLAMKQGLADSVVTDSVVLAGLAAGDPEVEIVGDFFTLAPLAIGVRHNDAKWRNALTFLLQDMWTEGRYKEVYESHFGSSSKYPLPLGFRIETWPK